MRSNNHSYTTAEINQFIRFLVSSTPISDKYLEQYQFAERSKQFTVTNGKLYCGLREVIAAEDVNVILAKLYANAATRVNGRDRLFKTLAEKYYGITKTAISAFLSRQELHQLHKTPIKAKDIVPIVAKYPYQRWQMDLVIIGSRKETPDGSSLTAYSGNNGYKYIFTIIDTFTKFAHTVPLKTRTSTTVAAALQEVLDREMEVDIHHCPSVLQSDNEFDTEEFKQLCDKYGIKQVFSKSHVSSSGAIERFNRTLKSAIWQQFTMQSANNNNNAKKWLDILPKITSNYNNTWHTVTKQIPSKLHPISGEVTNAQIHATKNNLQEAAKSKIEADKAQFPRLGRGDTVRVQLASIDATIRAQIKSGMSKGYVAQWSREIYKVKSVSKSKSEFIKSRYQLDGLTGVFARDQLQLVGKVDKIKAKVPKVSFVPSVLSAQSTTQVRTPGRKRPIVLRARPQVTTEPEYSVEAILGEKKEGNRRLYEVKWTGYADTTFEPLKNIKDTIAYDEYLKKQPKN